MKLEALTYNLLSLYNKNRLVLLIIWGSLLILLFRSSFLYSHEFFNGFVSYKQYHIELAALGVMAFLSAYGFTRKSFTLSLADAGFFLFCLWYLTGEIINGFPYQSFKNTVFHVVLWSSVYLFIRVSAGKQVFIWFTAFTWLVVVFLLLITGLLQLYGKLPSHHHLFNITGTFHNPGPFSGFVISALPLALGVLLSFRNVEIPSGNILLKWRSKEFIVKNTGIYLKYILTGFCYAVIILILLVVPAARSRAAWIAGVAGTLFIIMCHPGMSSWRGELKSFTRNLRLRTRILLVIAVLVMISATGTGLYLMKKGSAGGRVLIWQVSQEVIRDKPIAGHGAGSFNALYMPAQTDWFEKGRGSQTQVMVAGSPQAPFNEFIGLWLEKGLTGVLLATLYLFFIYSTYIRRLISSLFTHSRGKHKNIAGGASRETCIPDELSPSLKIAFEGTLISILTFSLFSYPFDISSFVLQLIVALAILGGYSPVLLKIVPARDYLFLPGFMLMALSLLMVYYFYPSRREHYQALNIWREAEKLYNYRAYNASTAEYEKAFPVLRDNGLFLQMYGKALNMEEQYERSIEVLRKAEKYYSSFILYNTLGDNHKAMGNYSKAEAVYLKSLYMMPSMLLPGYLLAMLYQESGQTEKAVSIARDVLSKPVKVESAATREIRDEMMRIVEGYVKPGKKVHPYEIPEIQQ